MNAAMTPRIITYFLCGMRHPTTGLSEDDLSRLTGSSSSTASSDSSSSSSSSTAANTPAHKEGADARAHHTHSRHSSPDKLTSTAAATTKAAAAAANALKNHNNKNNNNNNNNHSSTHVNSLRFSSTYLPEVINPLEWQRSRKRKERLDSSSSTTQDRKLQRSNSEELLSQESQADSTVAATAGVGSADALNAGAGSGNGNTLKVSKAADAIIRRVSSEDFKKTGSYAAYEQDLKEAAESRSAAAPIDKKQPVDENDASLANRQKQQPEEPQPTPVYRDSWVTGPTKDMTRRSRYETSPARSQRFSPIRSNGGKHRDSDDSECEHERRRSSERFCKSRLPQSRKAAGVTKKSGSSGGCKYLPPKRSDENAYKYDLSALKYERRGFISKKVISAEKAAAAAAAAAAASDHNDNNLIDFHQQQQKQQQQQQQPQISSGSNNASPTSSTGSDEATVANASTSTSTSTSTTNSNSNNPAPVKSNAKSNSNSNSGTLAQEALPWGRSVPEDQTPVLSRRYASVRHHPADNLDTAAKLSKVMPYPQQFHKQLYADKMDCIEPLDTFRAFTTLENVPTRDVMEQVIPAMMAFQSPEERLKQVNKRLTALKKKLAQLEEAYEARMGYRPSQAERLNDKYMKNILAELNKLRKERQELKTDPMGALGLKVSGGMDAAKKLEKMKATLSEIEQNLTDKREDANRSESLDELTADQLVQEKTAVQHGLLYFESLYGRPGTKDERDVARPLYDRYRQLKRMVTRSVMQSGSAIAGAPELPTILEDEAMVFEFTPQQYSSANSTDTTNSPSESVAPNASSDDSTTTTTTTAGVPSQAAADAPTAAPAAHTSVDTNENISDLNIEQLWEHLEKTREEKKLLKRTIREYETLFEEQNGRKMLKNDRKIIEETYAQYKAKKAKTRLLQELIKKQRRAFV